MNAHIYNYDFEEFLLKTNPTENDFIFLDPPYDSKFSSYDNNEFNRNDHKRLADYLLNKCKAKWMMIISKTDFIYDLYNQPGIHIQEYDKNIHVIQRVGRTGMSFIYLSPTMTQVRLVIARIWNTTLLPDSRTRLLFCQYWLNGSFNRNPLPLYHKTEINNKLKNNII